MGIKVRRTTPISGFERFKEQTRREFSSPTKRDPRRVISKRNLRRISSVRKSTVKKFGLFQPEPKRRIRRRTITKFVVVQSSKKKRRR